MPQSLTVKPTTKHSSTPVTVYILLCADGKYYTGITADIKRRLKEHHSGRTAFTAHRLPLTVVWSEVHTGYKIAARIEKAIKKRGAKRFLNDLLRYAQLNSQGITKVFPVHSPVEQALQAL